MPRKLPPYINTGPHDADHADVATGGGVLSLSYFMVYRSSNPTWIRIFFMSSSKRKSGIFTVSGDVMVMPTRGKLIS